MKKRLVTILLATVIAFGSLSPANVAYAQEMPVPAEEELLLDSAEDECEADASLEGSDDERLAGKESNEEDPSETSDDKAASSESSEEDIPAKENDSATDEASVGSSEELSEGDEADDAASVASSEEELVEETEDKELLDYNFKKNVYDRETKIATDANGELLTGWVNVDVKAGSTTYEVMAVGESALKRQEGAVYYISPATKTAVSGVNTIGGKKYLFYDSYFLSIKEKECQLARNSESEGKTVTNSSAAAYCVLPSGEICTGWQTVNGNEYHFSTVSGSYYGVRDTCKWIARGNGWTYVDDYGLMQDEFKQPLSIDGLHYIDDHQYTTDGRSEEFYVFKGGNRLTGLVYFDENDELTDAKNAKYVRYCDPETAIVQSGYVTLGGKKYYFGDMAFPTGLKKENLKTARAYGRAAVESFVDVTTPSKGTIFIEKSGAVAVNKLFTVDGDTYYAKEDGMLCKNAFQIVNGKLCHFNYEGVMDNSKASTDIYRVSVDGTTISGSGIVYATGKDSLLFYSDPECTKLIKNSWLIKGSSNVAMNRLYYLDKNGRPVKGIVTINKKKYAFDASTGVCVTQSARNNTYGGSFNVGGKYYLIAPDGEVNTKVGFVKDGGSYYYIKNTSGQLATGLTTIKGRKYFFDEEGQQRTSTVVTIGGKNYLINYGEGADGYVLSKKDINALMKASGAPENEMYFGSDGSLATGWKTIKGKKYYFFDGTNVALDNGSSDGTYLYMINGKMYYFDPKDGAMVKNKFLEIKKGENYTVESERRLVDDGFGGIGSYSYSRYAADNTAFYFGSNGVAVTGFKTVNGEKRYFYTEDNKPKDIYAGMMAVNTTLTINGKIYSFDGNGLINTSDNSEHQYNKDGSYATGKIQVKTKEGTKSYYYNLKTGKRESNVIRKTGKKWFYYGDDYEMLGGENTFTSGGKTIIIKHNAKDGSITGIYQKVGGEEVKLSNMIINCGSKYYYLGANGLPVTGLITLNESDSMDISGFPYAKAYIESDGTWEYDGNGTKKPSSSSSCSMIKSGKKIYVIFNGHTVQALGNDNMPAQYSITDYSSLPAADRANLDYYATQRYSGSTAGKFNVAVQADGSVGAYTFIYPDSDRIRLYMNKYGIPISDMGLFAKVGGSFYAIGDVSSAYVEKRKATNVNGEEVTLLIKWDNNLKLGKVTELESGKPANGYYELSMSKNPVMVFKNGAIQTGKQTVKLPGGETRTYYINPDSGWCLD